MCAGSTRSIEPDEAIIRRIPKCPGYYDPLKNPPIERGAFTPTRMTKTDCRVSWIGKCLLKTCSQDLINPEVIM